MNTCILNLTASNIISFTHEYNVTNMLRNLTNLEKHNYTILINIINIIITSHSVPDMVAGRCLEPEGNGISFGKRGEGGPGPPGCRGDKRSALSEEGGNMEKEEEGRRSRA
jgi:hypothetical protein